MRTFLVTALLVSIALAGCLDSGGPDDGTSEGSEQDGFTDDSNLAQKPEKRFEPQIDLVAESTHLEKGETVKISFRITDLDDYEYPLSFIDWNLTYIFEPNPVAEGEADDLPGTYERVLHKEGGHNFTFSARDGQGYEDSKKLVVWVGPLPEPEEEDAGDDGGSAGGGGEVVEMSIDESIMTVSSCSHVCNQFAAEKSAGYPGPFPCVGLSAGENGVDCAFVELTPGAAGSAFEVSSDFELNDPEVMFMETCATDAPYVGESINSGPESGVVPEGAGCLVTWEYVGVGSTITIHVDPWLEVVGGGGGGGDDPYAGMEDRGVYYYDPETSLCHAKDYDEPAPGLYSRDGWYFAETNDVPGLQLEANHPESASGFFNYPGVEDCVGGDQILA